MSGRLTVVPAATAPRKHDHVDIVLDDGKALRLNDPRRFGAVLWVDSPPEKHALISHLGLEPLMYRSAARRSPSARREGAWRSSSS
jgi:formamidopyrimidine-DNA glycosylase